MKFLTNAVKDGIIPLYIFKFFNYIIKISGKSTMKNIVISSKMLAKTMGYKKPKIFIFDNAVTTKGVDISDKCWAVYVVEQKR